MASTTSASSTAATCASWSNSRERAPRERHHRDTEGTEDAQRCRGDCVKVPLSWLREFVEVPVEPKQLAEDLTLRGLAVDAMEEREQDLVLALDITTNRVDCMNVYGVAREVSVVYGRPLRPPDLSFTETGPEAAEALDVAIESPDLCPRFCARVLDVRI